MTTTATATTQLDGDLIDPVAAPLYDPEAIALGTQVTDMIDALIDLGCPPIFAYQQGTDKVLKPGRKPKADDSASYRCTFGCSAYLGDTSSYYCFDATDLVIKLRDKQQMDGNLNGASMNKYQRVTVAMTGSDKHRWLEVKYLLPWLTTMYGEEFIFELQGLGANRKGVILYIGIVAEDRNTPSYIDGLAPIEYTQLTPHDRTATVYKGCKVPPTGQRACIKIGRAVGSRDNLYGYLGTRLSTYESSYHQVICMQSAHLFALDHEQSLKDYMSSIAQRQRSPKEGLSEYYHTDDVPALLKAFDDFCHTHYDYQREVPVAKLV